MSGEATAEAIKVRFKAQGLVEEMDNIRISVRRKWQEVNEATSRVIDTALKSIGMRGPDPDFPSEMSPSDRILLEVLREVRRPTMNNGDGENPGTRRLLAWILTVTSLLAVGGIGGGIVMYGEVASLRATVTQWQISSEWRQDQTERRLDRLENRP